MSSPLLTAFFVLLVGSFVNLVHSQVLFSNLKANLAVTASPSSGEVLMAGVDKITVSWKLNNPETTDVTEYKTLKIRLCYAPISQVDRAWRKTYDDLSIDKTCQFNVALHPYDSSKEQSIEYSISREVPTATFFIRAYVLDSTGKQVAYGQTTDFYIIKGITGRNVSLEIASTCFSAFSVIALVGYYFSEKRKNN